MVAILVNYYEFYNAQYNELYINGCNKWINSYIFNNQPVFKFFFTIGYQKNIFKLII